jgi:hypothetical protein
MSRKALEMNHLSLYRRLREGNLKAVPYTVDSERHVMDDSGNAAFLL